MTIWSVLQWLGTGGAGISVATLLGLLGRFVAWRFRVRDVLRYNVQLLAAQAAGAQLTPPPGMPEQLVTPDADAQLKPPPAHPGGATKALIGLLIVGLSLWAILPAMRASSAIASALIRRSLVNAAAHATPVEPQQIAKEGGTSPTRPGSKPRGKSCGGDRDCGTGCSCVRGQCSCAAVERKPSQMPERDQRADGQQRPMSADTPPKWQDTQPEGIPDRDPGVYIVNGQEFRNR